MNAIWKTLNFDPKNLTPGAIATEVEGAHEVGQMKPEEIAQISQYIFAVVLGFLLLVYISKFIEWAIFKAKL